MYREHCPCSAAGPSEMDARYQDDDRLDSRKRNTQLAGVSEYGFGKEVRLKKEKQ
jgi:hypothetical protein